MVLTNRTGSTSGPIPFTSGTWPSSTRCWPASPTDIPKNLLWECSSTNSPFLCLSSSPSCSSGPSSALSPFSAPIAAAAPTAAPPAATTSAPPPTCALNAATLRMRRYRNNRDLLRLRPITPEHPIRPRRAILRVRFKNFPILVVWICNRQKLVRLQPGMPRVCPQQLNAFVYLLEQSLRLAAFALAPALLECGTRGHHQLLINLRRFLEPNQFKIHRSVLDPGCQFFPRGQIRRLHKSALARFFQAPLHHRQRFLVLPQPSLFGRHRHRRPKHDRPIRALIHQHGGPRIR